MLVAYTTNFPGQILFPKIPRTPALSPPTRLICYHSCSMIEPSSTQTHPSPTTAHTGEGANYNVILDNYSGPLELLLYLIRRDEVDIKNIPIARITTQYLQHVEIIRKIDINLAGEFL